MEYLESGWGRVSMVTPSVSCKSCQVMGALMGSVDTLCYLKVVGLLLVSLMFVGLFEGGCVLCICMWLRHVTIQVCTPGHDHVWAKAGCQCLPLTFCLIALRWGLSLNQTLAIPTGLVIQ